MPSEYENWYFDGDPDRGEREAEEAPILDEEQQDYLWSVHCVKTNDPSNFVGLYEAPIAKDAIDMAVQESIRVYPKSPRSADELRATVVGKERDERGVWLPLKKEATLDEDENGGETDYSDDRTIWTSFDQWKYE
jgi:hypothetical protein